jgi:hypothetical protein
VDVSFDEISQSGYSFNPGQYFKVIFNVQKITQAEFHENTSDLLDSISDSLQKIGKDHLELTKKLRELKVSNRA